MDEHEQTARVEDVDERPKPRGRTAARIALAVLIVVVPVYAVVMALDAWQIRSGLEDARDHIEQVRRDVADGDVQSARASLDLAADELDGAGRRTGSLRWSFGAVLPVVGHPVDVVRDVVEVASVAVVIGQQAARDGDGLLGQAMQMRPVDGRIDLDPIRRARDLVDGLPIDELIAARAELARPRAGWVPALVEDGRRDTLALADEAVELAVRARAVASALPGFLGADEPRRYFVAIQTPAELRATGGLIGFWGILTFDDGEVSFGSSETFDPAGTDASEDEPQPGGTERIQRLFGDEDVGDDIDPDFTARYQRYGSTSLVSAVNVDPHLPSTAEALLALVGRRIDTSFDGLILLDPVGVQQLLQATGSPLSLPDELAALLAVEPDLPTDSFAQLATIDIYDRLGVDRSNDRNNALRQLGDLALLRVLEGDWDAPEMVAAVAEASSERHLQVYSREPGEQTAFSEIGVTGRLDPPADADLIAVTANNVVGGKQDVHLGHRFALDISFGAFTEERLGVARRAELAVTLDNPLTEGAFDEYVVGNCVPEAGQNSCFDGPPAWNWTWFSAWAPPGSTWVAGRTDDESLPLRDGGRFRDFAVIDAFQVTPPASTGTVELVTDGWAPLRQEEDRLVYEFRWWRQSKATPDLLDISVSPPEGWTVAGIDADGGGAGRGSGVHGDGQALTTEIVDGRARLHGTVTADTSLLVTLVPA